MEMSIFKIYFTIIFIQFSIYTPSYGSMSHLQQILINEERNSRCCAKHLSCCKNATDPTNFEVRALLTKCFKPDICTKHKNSKLYPGNLQEKSNRQGTCRKEEFRETVRRNVANCEKKLKLTIKIKNSGITNTKNQYIIIDHVYDPLSAKKQKILNPYILKIKQEPILQTYGLIFENMVNSEAKEKVVNKEDSGYAGCNADVTSDNPTCGVMKYNNQVIPFSAGFCCPCKTEQNENENGNGNGNVETENLLNDANIPSVQGIDESLKQPRNINPDSISVPNKNNYGNNYDFTGKVGRPKGDPKAVNIPNLVDNSVSSRSFYGANEQRLLPLSGHGHHRQKRGGQDCSNKTTPPDVNPDTYHDSTHCLEFSDLWYFVYRLERPKLFHCLQIQIFEKILDADASFRWIDLTKGNPIITGTDNKFYANEQNTITVNYVAREVSANMFALNCKIQKLLIPDFTKNFAANFYPEMQGGPGEYLVVNENQIQVHGKACDVAGVGYEAFAKQPNRCSVPKGSCLKNQPKQFWLHDHQAELLGKKGCYFLKNYGKLPVNPITINETTQNKTLTIFYTQCYTSILDLEIKADSNVVLRPNSLAVLTEVYVDSSSPKKTSIIAKVYNSGLVSSLFYVSLTDCPLDIPASFNNIVSKPVLIAPQHQHIFHLNIECPLPMNNFHCAVEVLNTQEELIAVRKIRLQKLDRCICIWHCLCACLLADRGLKCKPMSLEHYHAAGFQGSLAVPLHVVHYTFLDDMISLMLYILLFLCLTLLIMGLTKALIGCCMISVGLWGLDLILDLPKKMNSYYESSIKHRNVIYDQHGWPIHPDRRERVRNISLPAEFSINVVFFYIYPLVLFWLMMKKLCSGSYSNSRNYDDYDVCNCRSGTSVQKKNSGLQLSTSKKLSSEKSVKVENLQDSQDTIKENDSRPSAKFL